ERRGRHRAAPLALPRGRPDPARAPSRVRGRPGARDHDGRRAARARARALEPRRWRGHSSGATERRAMILLNPGPVNVSSRVTEALARGDICHREPECAQLLARIRARLLEAFAPRAAFTAVVLPRPGPGPRRAAVARA